MGSFWCIFAADFREFLVNLSVQLKGSLQEKLEWTFNLFDLDHTNSISRDELVRMLKVGHHFRCYNVIDICCV